MEFILKSAKTIIYDYLDCRAFLKDKCDELKLQRPGFSYRQLSLMANIKSPSFIAGFIAGKKNISHQVALRIAHVLELDPHEIEFFINLLNLAQGATHEEKKMALAQCIRQAKDHQNIEVETFLVYEYYANWYNVVIRDLIAVFDIGDDYKELSSLLDPPIKPEQAKESIDLLLKLGLIKKNNMGFYKRTHRFLTSKSHIKTPAVHDFQSEMMKKAILSLQRHNREIRDISTLTFSIDQSTYMHIFKMIESFRTSVLSLVKTINEPDQVVQLNIQLFPVSKCSKGK
jgi:uncharacterized protein (TIGR02147 family)